MDLEGQKQEFLTICHEQIQRPGLDDLLTWLIKADFFTAPASTRYHGAYEGGLCEHSLDVFRYAQRVQDLYDGQLKSESLAIASLFHDVCKVNFYKQDWKNQKVEGQWVQVPYYTVDEKFQYGGHGSKSVFLVERFMRLELEEAVAINCHMGFSEGGDSIRSVSNAYSAYPLAWVIHAADEAATYLLKR